MKISESSQEKTFVRIFKRGENAAKGAMISICKTKSNRNQILSKVMSLIVLLYKF